MVLGILVGLDRKLPQIASYRERAHEALLAKNFQAAHVAFQRLIELDPNSPEFRFGFATVSEAMGDLGRTAAIMDELAPLDRPGYGPAHLWQARHWLRTDLPSAIKRRFAEIQLYRAVQAQPENLEAHALLGQLLLDNGQLALAEKHLTKAVPKKPEVGLALARVYASRGAKDLAITTAEQAESFFRQHAEASIDNHQARLLQAEAALFLEKYAVAADILKQGQRLGGPPAYQIALVSVYAHWAAALARDSKSSPDARLALIQEGLQHDPSNLVLLQHLLDIAKVQNAEAGKNCETLRLLGDRLAVLGMLHSGPASQEAFQLLHQAAEAFRILEADKARSALRSVLLTAA
jgi:tetratricopeptide (TPR) repeat protein